MSSSNGPDWRYLVGALAAAIVFSVPGFLWAGFTVATLDAQEKCIDRLENYLERIEQKLDVVLRK